MNFRTELHPSPASYKLSLASKVVTVGSCFSDVIGSHLKKYKVETLTNPFGTIFNPLSACKLLQICAGADVELAESFVQNNGRWYSYDFHSSFSAETEEELYEMLDEVIVKTRRFLKKTDLLLFTLGTANIFRLNITGETVANCHKIPAANFTRETLLPEEIITTVAETHSLLRELNPNLKLGLTVSPVRHIKDSLELNSVSKAVLRLATHFLTENLPDISYFPAYELLIDDLRDYRFYKEDMLHPSPMAETYIWEKFTGAYFESSFQEFTQEWDRILRAKAHKPFHPASEQHQAFIQQTLEKLRTLQPQVDVTEEVAYFESQVMELPQPAEETEEETEDEVIPGYFSEEMKIPVAALEEMPVAQTTEEGAIRKKKKKKPRKKKKKPVIDGQDSLSEVGTTVLLSKPEPEADQLLSVAETETVAVFDEPEHPIDHYGETLSEAPGQQVKPAKSRSAKRRESRRKKKAFAVSENTPVPEASEEISALLQPTEYNAPKSVQTFSEEKATVSAPELPELIETPAPAKPEKAGKPAKKKPARREQKKPYPELFSQPEPENETKESSPEPIAQNSVPEPVLAETTDSVSKPKGKGRKPKATQLFLNEAEPITEKIAVPFVPAKDIEEPGSEEQVSTENKKPANRMRKQKTPKNNAPQIASKVNPVAENPAPVKEKAPAKKRVPKPKALKSEETTEADQPVKRGRKKKATPEV